MVKSILKKIFPIKILKNAFLVFNKIKIRTWDKLFFPEKFIPKEKFLIYEETNPFLDHRVPTHHLEQDAVEKLHLWLDPAWTQDQYFLYYKEAAFIEPDYGWAITSDHRLIYPSLGFSRAPHVNKPHLLKSYSAKKNVAYLSKIISLRDTGEENYFHFYNDVLAKLFFIADQNLNLNDFTIVVADKLFRKEFFQFFWKNSRLKNLRWHIQKDEWVRFEEAILCKPYTHTKKYFDLAIDLIPHKPSTSNTRRIFLTRPKSSLRFIENMDDLIPMLTTHQFEIVDTTNMKVADQIELFSSCRYLISIHGAGLTNMIYRKGSPLTILEIMQPSSYIPFHYILLAHLYNYGYNAILGERGHLHNQGGFRVDSRSFSIKLEAMINVRQ